MVHINMGYGASRFMRKLNSQSRFYLELLTRIYHDLVSAFSTQTEYRRDLETISNRYASEGLSFFTRTLPRLGKSVDKSLATGETLQISNFKVKKGTRLPAFMQDVFSVLFCSDGAPRFMARRNAASQRVSPEGESSVRTEDSHSRETEAKALKALRQVCYCFYKLNLPFTDEQETQVIKDFISAEEELRKVPKPHSVEPGVILIARQLIARVLCNSHPSYGVPRHGPGAVATREKSSEKHHFRRYYTRLASVFNYADWFHYNGTHVVDSLKEFLSMEELEYGTAKVVLVPKDSRGPRLISCEPLEYQWVQQALKGIMVDTIEQHPLTSGYVNFTDQTINQRLSLEGSQHPYKWVTLDMKEASDRVSLELVEELFPKHWFDALYASRSPQTELPSGEIVQMCKFAPMGSAVCFPVEALVFWALSVATLHVKRHTPLEMAATTVYVYGDDIIVHQEDHLVIADTLPKFGLKLNSDKCCTAGPFKESCGMDAYEGHSVVPLRIRNVWYHRQEASLLASYVAFHNAAYKAGMHSVCDYLYSELQKIWRNRIPTVSDRNPGVIAFVKEDQCNRGANSNCRSRWNNHLQRREIEGIRLKPVTITSRTFGFELMLRVIADKTHKHALPGGYPVDDGGPKGPSCLREYAMQFVAPITEPTGQYAMAHRVKPSRAWTPYTF